MDINEQLEKILESNDELRKVFEEHPERKELYIQKMIDEKNAKGGCATINPRYCETCLFCTVKEPFGKLPKIVTCEIYKAPLSKPKSVYYEGTQCEYYHNEKDAE